MQAAVTQDQRIPQTPAVYRMLFNRFWEDVAPLNNYSPEAARALLDREMAAHQQSSHDEFPSDPWVAVRAALRERAAGRRISR
jgi:hypothetical protein